MNLGMTQDAQTCWPFRVALPLDTFQASDTKFLALAEPKPLSIGNAIPFQHNPVPVPYEGNMSGPSESASPGAEDHHANPYKIPKISTTHPHFSLAFRREMHHGTQLFPTRGVPEVPRQSPLPLKRVSSPKVHTRARSTFL